MYECVLEMKAAFCSLLVAGAAHAGTVWVAWPDEPGPCGFDQIASALRARLPAQTVEAGRHALEPGSAQVALGRDGTDWLLEVQTEGNPALKRRLSSGEGDCLALSERASLVVDRYLEDLHWTGESPGLDKPAPPPVPGEAVHWHGVAELEVGGGAGLVDATPVGGLSVGVQRGALWLLAEASTQLPGQRGDPTTNVINVEDLNLEARLGLGIGLPRGTLRLELMPGAALLWASTGSGANVVFHEKTDAVASPFLGARIAYTFPLTSRLYCSFAVQGRYLFIQETFAIDGYPTNFVVPRTYVEGTAGLGYLFF